MFYSIPNLASVTAKPIEKPWELCSTCAVPESSIDKDKHCQWCMDPATAHHFLSMVEGMSSTVRVSDEQGNPAFQVHGIIADYDAPITGETADHLKRRPQSEHKPQWLVRTFSGNARLVFVFERPILIATKEQYKKFMVRVAKELKLTRWLAGLDTEALADVARYYELGREWQEVFPGSVIQHKLATLWLFDASLKLILDPGQKQAKVPMEVLTAEVRNRFPGKWNGPFEIGRRGVRFWDPSADNDTAAIVREDGMQCFTGPEPFVSWRKIFGSTFVDEYEADRISGILDITAYDGKFFWTNTNEAWINHSKEDFGQALRVRGFSKAVGKGRTCSEIDEVEHTVKTQRRVMQAMPFLYYPTGIIRYSGTLILNTSTIEVTQPAAPYTEGLATWADGAKSWPWIHKILRNMFREEGDDKDDVPLMYFLAWFKYSYMSAWKRTPRPGHIIFITGPKNKGKTLLAQEVIGKALARDMLPIEATDTLINGSTWTDSVATSPVLLLDDAEGPKTQTDVQRYTARLKKLAANCTMSYNRKYHDGGQVPWFGRVVALCNEDSDSMRMVPNMDMATRDKIMLFKASKAQVQFMDRDAMGAAIADELPRFLRYLVDMEYPECTLSRHTRYFVESYHHPELLCDAMQQGTAGVVLELLEEWTSLMKASPDYKDRDCWEGTASVMLDSLGSMRPGASKELNTKSLGVALGTLARNGYNLKRFRMGKSGIAAWGIGFDLTKNLNIGGETKEENDDADRVPGTGEGNEDGDAGPDSVDGDAGPVVGDAKGGGDGVGANAPVEPSI